MKLSVVFNPIWQLSPTQLLPHFPRRDRGENRKSRSEITRRLRLRQFNG